MFASLLCQLSFGKLIKFLAWTSLLYDYLEVGRPDFPLLLTAFFREEN